MKQVLQIAILGALSMGAVTVQAQDNWHRDRDGSDRSAYVDNNRHERYSQEYDHQRYSGGYDNDRRDDRYRGDSDYGYSDRGYQTYRHSGGRSAAIIGGSAAAGAAIGAAAGHGQGAVIGAFAGGITGFIIDQATREHHHDRW